MDNEEQLIKKFQYFLDAAYSFAKQKKVSWDSEFKAEFKKTMVAALTVCVKTLHMKVL